MFTQSFYINSQGQNWWTNKTVLFCEWYGICVCVPQWVAGSDGSGFPAALHWYFLLCVLLFVESVYSK